MLVLALVVSTSFFIQTMRLPPCIRHASLPLLASLAMNLALGTVLIVGWWTQQKPTASASAAAIAQAPVKTETKTKPVTPITKPAAFHWKQLDAPDFPTFVKNLRGIGCPEATIRDIIQGELREIYGTKQQEMEREIAIATPAVRTALEQRLNQMAMEESSLLASLTRATVPERSVASNPSTSSGIQEKATAAPNVAAKPQTNASILAPAAFLAGNDPNQPAPAGELSLTPTDPRLNPATVEVISQMRSDFARSLETAGTDPSSVVYRQRWLSAQRESDERFSSLFGGDSFIHTQLEAAHTSSASATNSTP